MFENPRRGKQPKNFATNVPRILDLKSSSEQIFSENCRWVPLFMLKKKGRVRSERTHYFVLGPSSLFLFVKEIKTKETMETKSFINVDVYPFMMPDTRK